MNTAQLRRRADLTTDSRALVNSREYRGVIEDLYQCVDAQGWDDLGEFFAEDVVYQRPGYAPLIGLDAVLDFYRRVRVVASGRHHLEQILVDGEQVACWGRFEGRHRNHSPIDERFADVYTLDGKKITSRQTYFFRPAV